MTVYQGHISEAHLSGSADAGLRSARTVWTYRQSYISASLRRSQLIYIFFLVPRPNLQTLVKTLIMFWNILASASLGLLPVYCVVLFCVLVYYIIYCYIDVECKMLWCRTHNSWTRGLINSAYIYVSEGLSAFILVVGTINHKQPPKAVKEDMWSHPVWEKGVMGQRWQYAIIIIVLLPTFC